MGPRRSPRKRGRSGPLQRNRNVLGVHIVQDGTSAFVGSENFSTGSLKFNRELGVIFNAAAEVQKVLSTTASDFARGTAL